MAYQDVNMGTESEGRLKVLGLGPLDGVKVEVVSSTLEVSEERRALLPSILTELQGRGVKVTDDPVYRLESWIAGETLLLRLSERSYFDSVLLKRYQQWGIRSQVLAVVAVTLCPQGFLVEKRSAQVAALPGRLHPLPSGSVVPPNSPLETLLIEAEEELGLLPQELTDISCLGLIYGEGSGVFQLVARVTTPVSLQRILQRSCSGGWEKDEILLAPCNPVELSCWLGQNRERLTVGGRVALVMEGGRLWGRNWLEGNLP
jgi:8-oxo-dGTP pyrophosphatase MutT (NUDIX family)